MFAEFVVLFGCWSGIDESQNFGFLVSFGRRRSDKTRCLIRLPPAFSAGFVIHGEGHVNFWNIYEVDSFRVSNTTSH
jgi:hypothetical protein